MNNRAFGTMGDVGPLVVLANALMAAWPADRPLELIHAPFAAADHQAENARSFEQQGAAVVIPDAELTGPRLAQEVGRLLADPERLAEYRTHAGQRRGRVRA